MKTALPIVATEETALIVEGTVSTALVAILQTAVLRMIPYAIPGLALLLLDLLYGVRAAKSRGERVHASTAISRTVTKLFKYICWLILASTLAISFGKDWLEWGTLAVVYGNEGLSIIGNYLESKGLSFSLAAVYRWIIKFFAGKVGGGMSDDEATEILKEGQDAMKGIIDDAVGIVKPRDKKGHFVKKETKDETA